MERSKEVDRFMEKQKYVFFPGDKIEIRLEVSKAVYFYVEWEEVPEKDKYQQMTFKI